MSTGAVSARQARACALNNNNPGLRLGGPATFVMESGERLGTSLTLANGTGSFAKNVVEAIKHGVFLQASDHTICGGHRRSRGERDGAGATFRHVSRDAGAPPPHAPPQDE